MIQDKHDSVIVGAARTPVGSFLGSLSALPAPTLGAAAIRLLELDAARVNVNGAAVAFGHPIGASGARLLTTLLYEMNRRQAALGLVTRCRGGGEGVALVVERSGPR